MRIFLSYPSSRRATAEDIAYALQAQRHDVFFDKDDLPAGQSYIQRIQDEIEACDLFIFVVTPASLEEGRFTLTELGIARKAWPQPAGRVLPVMIEPTPFDEIPAFLRSVTVLIPEGNVAAEVALTVEDMAAASSGERAERLSARADDGETEESGWSYEALEIRLGPGVAAEYDVSVSEVSGGDTYSGACSLDGPALEEQLRSSAGVIEGTVRRARTTLGETAESLMPSAEDAQAVGSSLYESLLASPVRPGLEVRAAELDPQRGEGLRFLINMTEAPDLARLPWEFLYDARQDDFIFLDPMKTVIRTLDVNRPAPSLALQSPVRLLVAVAAPEGRPELKVGQEIAHMDRSLSDLVKEQRVEIQRLDHTTLEELDEALLDLRPHVLHFIGHGGFEGNGGVIVLEEPTREPHPVTGRQLGVLLRNHLGSLRLVFLNSCLGAAIPVGDPFGGVAQNLIRRGVPAVIAMQFPIPDRDAVALARHFYRYLAAGRTVDAALTSARSFLFADGREVEWGAPALYMQAGGALFPDEAPARSTPPLEPEVQLPPSTGLPDGQREEVPIGSSVAAAEQAERAAAAKAAAKKEAAEQAERAAAAKAAAEKEAAEQAERAAAAKAAAEKEAAEKEAAERTAREAADTHPNDRVAKLEVEADEGLDRRRRPVWLWLVAGIVALLAALIAVEFARPSVLPISLPGVASGVQVNPPADDIEVQTPAGAAIAIPLGGTDPDPELVFSLVGEPPPGGSLSLSGAVVTYTPDQGFSGPYEFTYQVSDPSGGSAQATVKVTVNPPPPADDIEVQTPAGAAIAIPLGGTDPDPELVFSLVGEPPPGGSLSLSGAVVTYTPDQGFSGPYEFTYQVSDPSGGSAQATVKVTVTPAELAYIIVRGDTLRAIAGRYGTTVERIAADNGIGDPDVISVGSTLLIHGADRYVVKRGDTLSEIAVTYGTTVAALVEANPEIADPDLILIGQELVTPTG